MAREKVLEVKNLSIAFKTPNGLVKAVRDVSFDLEKGETLAIVGESGSGKSVTNSAIMGILARNGVIENGEILFQNQDLAKLSEANFHKIRGRKIGMIFQDPLSSLNPTMKIGKQITEAMLVNGDRIKNRIKDLYHHEYHDYLNQKTRIQLLQNELEVKLIEIEEEHLTKSEEKAKKAEEKAKVAKQIAELKKDLPKLKKAYKDKKKEAKEIVKKEVEELKAKKDQFESNEEYIRQFKVTNKEAYDRAIEIMTEVGIGQPEKRFNQYPFQFSGGMRQRIVIAIALAANPELLICDEPTTALDVTIQQQILNLIKSIKKYHDLSIIFITHDLGVVANMADRVAVMYAGKIVEHGTSEEIFYDSRHPYTWALLSSVPDLDTTDKLLSIPGTPPDMLFPPKGDAFADRNKYALKIDFEEQPPFFKVSDTHYAATWLLHPDAPNVEIPKIIQDRVNKYVDDSKKDEKGDVK
jgi:oligopeptide transport system ATP-binding protein